MDLRQLRYFVAVAEHEHMTRAAATLFVSQPALSQQIAALERELDTPLFDRLGRGLELTHAGRVFREHAYRVLREVENARAAVDDLRGAVRGELAIATIQTANVGFLVEVIARFRAQHSGVVVRVREERAAAVVEAVRRGETAMGLTYAPLEAADGLEVVPLYTEDLVLVVPAGHALAGATLATADVAGLPLVVPPGGYCLRRSVDGVLAEAGVQPVVVAEITALEAIGEAVRAGIGLSILPARFIAPRAAERGLATALLTDPVPRRAVVAVRSTARHACTATRAFLAALQEAARVP